MKRIMVLMVLMVALPCFATLSTVTATLYVSNADGTFPTDMPDVTCSVTYMSSPNPTPIIYSPTPTYTNTTGAIVWTVPQNSYIKVGCKSCYGFTTPSNFAIATSNVVLNDMVASTPPDVASVDSFVTIDCPSGTDPVADTAIDTLTLAAGTGLTITGDSATDSVTFVNSAPDQTVALTGGGITAISGTYPNFTITSTEADTLATVCGRNSVTGTSLTADSGIFTHGVTIGDDEGNGGALTFHEKPFATDYVVSLSANISTTSNAAFYLPADEPTGEAFLKMGTDGIMDFDYPGDYAVTSTGLKYKTQYIFQTATGFSNFAFLGALPSGITTGTLNVSMLGGLSNLTSGMSNLTWGDDAGDIIDDDSYNVAIGHLAFAGTASGADNVSEGTAIGYSAGRNNGGRFSTFLGYFSGNAGGDTPNIYDAVVCLGAQAQPNKAHQGVIGGNCSDDYIDELFVNPPAMVGTDAPAEIAIRTTNGSGTNKDGSDLSIKPGQSTGTGAGGVVNIYAGTTGVSGSDLNALSKIVVVNSTGMTVNGSAVLTSEVDGVVGNEVTDTNGTTLTRSGTGTSGDPYKLALNLGNGNTWTVGQVIDGTADENQLRIQSNSTQNTYPFLVENSSGTDTFYTTNSGSIWVKNYILLDSGIIEQNTSGTTLTINGYQSTFTGAGPGVKINTPPMSGTTASTGFNVSSTNTKSANAHSVMSITPTYNQTSTAGGTDLTINRTETAVGSGAQFLIDAQTGGASKFSVTNGGLVANRVKSITIPDSGGAGAAAYTINPEDLSVAAGAISSYIELTCSDADGCDITMGETDVVVGTILNVVNIGTNVCNFADTGGVSELAGAFAAGQYDSLSLRYATGTWVETGRSNN